RTTRGYVTRWPPSSRMRGHSTRRTCTSDGGTSSPIRSSVEARSRDPGAIHTSSVPMTIRPRRHVAETSIAPASPSPLHTGLALDRNASNAIRSPMELEHCKWDAQVGDVPSAGSWCRLRAGLLLASWLVSYSYAYAGAAENSGVALRADGACPD